MAFRFRKTIKVLPGLNINLSKTGVSVSAGVKGAKVTVGKNGVRKTVGIPGTGLSWTDYQKHGNQPAAPLPSGDSAPGGGYSAPGKILAALALLLLLAMCVAKMPK